MKTEDTILFGEAADAMAAGDPHTAETGMVQPQALQRSDDSPA